MIVALIVANALLFKLLSFRLPLIFNFASLSSFIKVIFLTINSTKYNILVSSEICHYFVLCYRPKQQSIEIWPLSSPLTLQPLTFVSISNKMCFFQLSFNLDRLCAFEPCISDRVLSWSDINFISYLRAYVISFSNSFSALLIVFSIKFKFQ